MEALPLVDRIAGQIKRQTGDMVDFEDLRQIGRLALIEIVPTFDPSTGVPFNAWVSRRVRSMIIDRMVKLTGHSRDYVRKVANHKLALQASTGTFERVNRNIRHFVVPNSQQTIERDKSPQRTVIRGEAAEDILERHSEYNGFESPSVEVRKRDRINAVHHLLDALNTEERYVLKSHYLHGESLAKLAREAGKSRSWLSRVHAEALEKMREIADDQNMDEND